MAQIARKNSGKNIGTSDRPRASVFRSNQMIAVQLIDDQSGRTLLAQTSGALKEKSSPVKLAYLVGEVVAKAAKNRKIKSVVFDRNGYRYHGQVKALAEGMRAGGLIL